MKIKWVKRNVILETVNEASEVFKGTSLENRNFNIDVTDIEKVFKTLKNIKATGFDNIKLFQNVLPNHLEYRLEIHISSHSQLSSSNNF
jgi:hypothetical protein